MANKRLTILLTLYKPTKEQIHYWTMAYKELKEFCDFHWLIDGTEVNLNKDEIASEDIYEFKINRGRLSMVYEHIKSGAVKTDYIKNADPDDFISIKMLREFPLPKENNKIINYNSTKIFGQEVLEQDEVDIIVDDLSKKIHMIPSYGTSYTIIPTIALIGDEVFSGNRIDADDDQILGYLAFVNGAEILWVENSFYLYSKFAGQTSPSNFLWLLKNLVPAYMEYESIFEKTKIKFGHNFPSIQSHIKTLSQIFSDEHRALTKEENEILEFILKERRYLC